MTAYEVLGVDVKATDEEIQKAYKAMARKYHPDKNNGDDSKMVELNEAMKMVGTPEARKKYDENNANTAVFRMMETVFGRPTVARDFGKAPVNQDPKMKNGKDINLKVSIPLDVYLGGMERAPIKFCRKCECLDCSGTGGNRKSTCPVCGGYGYVVKDGKKSSCTRCNGTGSVVTKKCKTCNGKGFLKNKVEKIIAYRPGSLTATIKGAGDNGMHGGTNGDLLITFNVKPVGDAFFDPADETINIRTSFNIEDFVLGVTKRFMVGNWSAYVSFTPDDMKKIPIIKTVGRFKFKVSVDLEINKNDAIFAQELRNSRINELI